ncbi:MAG TPA: hypothetical protein VGH02_10045 [Rhizomicrobium sp.]|jgi:hypothetical protein
MNGRIGALILVALLGCAASWMLGYREGKQTGAYQLVHEMGTSYDRDVKNNKDMDRDQICWEIRRYKRSIAKDLDENTQICGYRDMDGPEPMNGSEPLN